MKRSCLTLFLAALAGCHSQGEPLRLGSGTDEPAPTIVRTLADCLREAGFDVSVMFFDDSHQMFEALDGSRIDIALVEEPLVRPGRETMLLPVYPSVLHALGRADSMPMNFVELLSSAIYAGLPGSLGHDLVAALAEDFGVVEPRILDDPWRIAPDAYLIFGGLLSDEAIGNLRDFRLIDLPKPAQHAGESIVDSIVLRYPNLRPFTLPADLYPELGHEPVHTLAVMTLLASRADLSDKIAYRVTQQVLENWRTIRTIYPLATGNSIQRIDRDDFVLPLHQGARRYIERDRPGFVEEHIDLIALGTTLAMAGVSAAIGLVHRRKKARKDRVDTYLTSVLAVRRRLCAESPEEALAKVDEIEKEVLELVVAEKIEADSGLIAFLMLCGSVRMEITDQAR